MKIREVIKRGSSSSLLVRNPSTAAVAVTGRQSVRNASNEWENTTLPLPLVRLLSLSLSLSPSPSISIAVDVEGKKAVMLHLKDIVPAAQNNIDTKLILLEKGRTTLEGQNKTCLALVADETAAVHYQLWGVECDAFETGDIILLTNGIFSYHHSNLVLRAGKRGKVLKVGEFTMAYVETPNMSEIHWIPDPNNSKKYVQQYVISPQSRIFPSMP